MYMPFRSVTVKSRLGPLHGIAFRPATLFRGSREEKPESGSAGVVTIGLIPTMLTQVDASWADLALLREKPAPVRFNVHLKSVAFRKNLDAQEVGPFSPGVEFKGSL